MAHPVACFALAVAAALLAACADQPLPVAPGGTAPVLARGGNGDNNGRILFLSDRDTPNYLDVYSMNPDGTGVTRLTSHPGHDMFAAWSPDGKKVAFASDRHDLAFDIYVMNADGTGVTRLTNSVGADWTPTWSKDGKRIAFASTRDAADPADLSGIGFDVYVMNADGSGVTRLTTSAGADWMPAWSPDGKRIAFVSGRDYPETGLTEIYSMNVDGSAVTRLTFEGKGSLAPAWAPGGKQLAFSNGDGVAVMNADGTQLTLVASGPAHFPSWSDDGKMLAFTRGEFGTEDIYVMRADGSAQTQLTFQSSRDVFPSWRR